MYKGIKIVFLAILPFLIMYAITGFLWTGNKQTNVLTKVQALTAELGENVNFWLDFSDLAENGTRAWNKITNPEGNIFEKVGQIITGIGEMITIPIDFMIQITGLIIEPVITIVKFLRFE